MLATTIVFISTQLQFFFSLDLLIFILFFVNSKKKKLHERKASCIYYNIVILGYIQKTGAARRETLAQVFSCEFRQISKNTFFTE